MAGQVGQDLGRLRLKPHRPAGAVQFAAGEIGRSVNYSPVTGSPPSSAYSRDAQAGLTLRAGAHVRLSETYLYRRLSAPGGATALLRNHIWRSKLNWQITRPLSVRAIVDYDALLPNAGLVSTERRRRITGDVLLSWVLLPGTAVSVGYTDRREACELLGRQVFVKLSYLWRM